MGIVKLEPRCPKRSATVPFVDPDPNWTLDDLLSELNSLEAKLGHQTPSPLKQPQQEFRGVSKVGVGSGSSKPFVMSISDDDDDDDELDDDSDDYDSVGSQDERTEHGRLIPGTRFSCNDLDLSDSEESDVELNVNLSECTLMHKNGLEEGILFDLQREQQLTIKEQVRNTCSELELHHQKNCERSQHAMLQLQKYVEERRDIDRRVDNQYQGKMAEVLDTHLSAVQKDLEQRSQIEERRIRNDAAVEEAKRKEKALHEEKLQREKARAEAEAREKAAKLAEEQRLAREAVARAAEEAARKETERAAEEASAAALKAAQDKVDATVNPAKDTKQGHSSLEEAGIKVMAADAALKAEEGRLRIYNDVAKGITNVPQKGFEKYGRKILRIVSQLTGTREAVRSRAHDIINTINDPMCPRPIATLIFAQKVVLFCETPRVTDNSRLAFACAQVILLVSSQVPSVMDFVLAELHKACIYTVPKYLYLSKAAARNKDYWKMIGFREEENKMESPDSYLERVQAYMKLYGALVQTEIQGIRNPHGLERGWAWLAMFLNSLPPSRVAAFALDAFLRMAGFGLYRRYKSQFMKILNVISSSYLPALKRLDDQKMGEIVNRLEGYVADKEYQREPEGLRLEEGYLLSEELF